MWTILVIILLALCYIKLRNVYNYWQTNGIPFIKPVFLFGNFASSTLGNKSIDENLQSIYDSQPDKRYLGFYYYLQPMLLVRDPQLIKQITIKDFEAFPDHITALSQEIDSLWSKNLFSLSNKDGWAAQRAIISPAFTSSKLRKMFYLMQECAEQFLSYLNAKEGIITLEMRNTTTKYSCDVIGRTAFGVDCNSIKDENNQFYVMGKEMTSFNPVILLLLVSAISPKLAKIFRIRIIKEKIGNFFRNVITETLRIRANENVVRHDIIHELIQAQKEGLRQELESVLNINYNETKVNKKNSPILSNEDITGLVVGLFFAGFDTASTFLAYVSYELAENPDIQQTLYEEVNETLQNCNGKITYDSILAMKYLDNVVSETLRLHPPAFMTDRKCVKTYVIAAQTSKENTVLIEKGTTVWIPIKAIHRDPKYYPNPNKFNPERFNDTNKPNIQQYTFLPFGLGPRNCIGSRFAIIESKILIANIVANYKLIHVEKTEASRGNPSAQKGIWIGLERRE